MDPRLGTASTLFRWVLCLCDGLAGGLFTFGGLVAISNPHAAEWGRLAVTEAVASLGCGLTLLFAAISLAAVPPPRCWTIGARTHAFAAFSLGLSIAAIFVLLPHGPPNHMDLSRGFHRLLIGGMAGLALICLVAMAVLIALARHTRAVQHEYPKAGHDSSVSS
jgi:hypothetical protein